ncbi:MULTISPECIES: hypothetical protein [unclassified Leucobacter]|uniref:hypothetical protein n=1 Tax=unclassified Leucobacter TaxID=2621730 RepID=UPI00301A085A
MAHTVLATEVRRHLLQLQAAGFPIGQIARRASLPVACLVEIATGTRKEVLAYTAQRVLAVKPMQHSPGEMLSARGAQRRVQSLHAVGWSARAIAENAQWSTDQLATLMRASSISRFRHDQISAVFSRLWDKRPVDQSDAEAARQLAAENSWSVPLAWDDFDTDEGPATITPADELVEVSSVEAVLLGEPLSHEEILAEDERLRARKVPTVKIAQKLGIGRATLYRIRAAAAEAATQEPSELEAAPATEATAAATSIADLTTSTAKTAETPAEPCGVDDTDADPAACNEDSAEQSDSSAADPDCLPDHVVRARFGLRYRGMSGGRSGQPRRRRARSRPELPIRAAPGRQKAHRPSLSMLGMSSPPGIVVHSPPLRFHRLKEFSSS